MQDEPNHGGPQRPDLTLMRSHGEAVIVDGIVDLFCDAMLHAAATLHRDGSTRLPDQPLAGQADIDERISAACLGAARAFTDAAELRWSLPPA